MIIIETCPKCGHDLVNLMIATYPPIPKKQCWNCGWSWEGEREEVVRVPFSNDNIGTTTPSTVKNNILNNIPECCKNCSNYPVNGGYTICACTKPYMTIT